MSANDGCRCTGVTLEGVPVAGPGCLHRATEEDGFCDCCRETCQIRGGTEAYYAVAASWDGRLCPGARDTAVFRP